MKPEDLITTTRNRDELYLEIANSWGSALARVARAYEADPDKRRDLLQEIHLEIWRSLAGFRNRCSLRTWIYRIAHNVGASHVIRQKKLRVSLVSLEDVELPPAPGSPDSAAALRHLHELIGRLKPLDRQIVVSWLEGMDAASTAEITGLTSTNVAVKLHRIRKILVRQFHEGDSHGE